MNTNPKFTPSASNPMMLDWGVLVKCIVVESQTPLIPANTSRFVAAMISIVPDVTATPSVVCRPVGTDWLVTAMAPSTSSPPPIFKSTIPLASSNADGPVKSLNDTVAGAEPPVGTARLEKSAATIELPGPLVSVLWFSFTLSVFTVPLQADGNPSNISVVPVPSKPQ